LTVNLPEMDGPCSLWARVQGPAGAEFVAATQGKSLKLTATATSRWTWVKADGTFELRPGKNEVTVSRRLYGSALDCLAISNDPRFIPETSPRIRWPKPAVVQAMKAETTSPYAVQLKWPSADNPAFHHYNLYCGHEPDFPSDQSTVVASPDQNAYCDWGLKPGQTIYYRLTAVDRAGNESTSSTPVKVVLPKLDRVLLERAPSDRVGFEVPRTDLYALWLKIKNGGSGGQYINVKVDNEPAVTWTCAFDGLSDESWFTYDQWGRFPLKAGRHVVAVENKTKNTIESILLTNDLSFRPEGHVNILSGW